MRYRIGFGLCAFTLMFLLFVPATQAQKKKGGFGGGFPGGGGGFPGSGGGFPGGGFPGGGGGFPGGGFGGFGGAGGFKGGQRDPNAMFDFLAKGRGYFLASETSRLR